MSSPALPPTLRTTREALHRVAEHVVSPARYAVTGRIGLRAAPGGFATPPFGDDDRVVAVDVTDLVVLTSDVERRAHLTTLRAAAGFVGVTAGAPAHLYTPVTPLDLDEPLEVDPVASRLLAEWYQLGDEALRQFAAAIAEDEPSEAQLWPEHFDLGISAGQVNYGVSPGDEHVSEPYVYVGPHDPPVLGEDPFWNASFGAARTIHEIRSADAAAAFFHAGRQRAASRTAPRGITS